MSEELLQRKLDKDNPSSKIGKWDYYNIGATSLKALKGAKIIRNIDYGKQELKKVDALIVNRKDVIAIIEFKQPKEFRTIAQQKKAIKQEIEVAKKLGSKIIIATDNDVAGNRYYDQISAIVSHSERDKPDLLNDWNDCLAGLKAGKNEENEESGLKV